MSELRIKLNRTLERVARLQEIVAQQIGLVLFLKKARPDDVEDAEDVLLGFLRSLDLATDYERMIRSEIRVQGNCSARRQ